MSAYAIAHLRNPQLNDEVLTYIDAVQATFEPFGGRFLVHGADIEVLEDEFPGTVVLVEFPDLDAARAWYHSPGYQEILPLRTNNIDGAALIVEGVGPEYDARVTAARYREMLAGSEA